MNYVDIICFDSVAANKEFYETLKNKENESKGAEIKPITLFKEIPSIEFIVQELQRLR